MSGPQVSVVIPCYNAERYLGEALDSVLSQPCRVEPIVVDDGSSDGSVAVASAFGTRVTLVRQHNQGASVARNAGIMQAAAPVIGFLDADDLFAIDSLPVRLAVLAGDETVDGVAGLTQQFLSPDLPWEARDRMACAATPVRGRVAGAMLLRRTVFDRVGLFDASFRMGETLDWVARADAAGIRFTQLDDVVLHRRLHATNSVHQEARLHADYLRVLRSAIGRRRAAERDQA